MINYLSRAAISVVQITLSFIGAQAYKILGNLTSPIH